VRGSLVAWWVVGVSAVLAVVDTAVVLASYPLLSEESVAIHGWPLVNVAALGSAVIGAVILGSQPRHPIGRLLNLVGLTTSISLACESYGIWVLQHDGAGDESVAHLSGWTAAALGGPLALACLTITFLLVPAGRYLSPRWRLAAGAAVAGLLAYTAGLVVVGPGDVNRNGDPIDASALANILLSGGVMLIALALLASVASMALRLRASVGAVRQQVRVVTLGAASVGLALVALIIGQSSQGGRQVWWTSVPLYASYAFLVVCLAVAVLRYRLYDVQVIISRALVLAIATGLVAAGYVGVVVALGGMVGDRADGGFWASLLATVLVAVAFQPVRRSVVRVADRLAYGERAAPYEALAAFSRRIGRSPATSHLLPTIAAAAGEAVSADAVVVRLAARGDGEEQATWPPAVAASTGGAPGPETADVVVPIRDEAGVLGSIGLRLPPGRDVRPGERRLLSDIAEQAALALRNDRLQIELAARVRQLDLRTRELAASRNRLLGVADAARQRLESEIGRRVIPTIRRLRDDVERAAAAPVRPEPIGACVELATEALESLRELTRGIYPTMLTRSGLGAALTSYAARTGRAEALRVATGVAGERFPARVEAAAYFCCVEVLARPGGELELDLTAGTLVLSITGVGLDALDRAAVVDRVEACEGSIDEPDSTGSVLRVRLPVNAPRATPAAAGPG
jgi:hypothetical protein